MPNTQKELLKGSILVKVNPKLRSENELPNEVRSPKRFSNFISKRQKDFSEFITTSKEIVDRIRGKKKLLPPNLLEKYTKNLTEKAALGELDKIIGREQEIQVVINTLCRRTKSNAALLGPAGVGKTAIAEGLANFLWRRKMKTFHSGKPSGS